MWEFVSCAWRSISVLFASVRCFVCFFYSVCLYIERRDSSYGNSCDGKTKSIPNELYNVSILKAFDSEWLDVNKHTHTPVDVQEQTFNYAFQSLFKMYCFDWCRWCCPYRKEKTNKMPRLYSCNIHTHIHSDVLWSALTGWHTTQLASQRTVLLNIQV